MSCNRKVLEQPSWLLDPQGKADISKESQVAFTSIAPQVGMIEATSHTSRLICPTLISSKRALTCAMANFKAPQAPIS